MVNISPTPDKINVNYLNAVLIMMRDIAHDLGEVWLPVFLRHYGIPANKKKNAFFRLLDEFF